MHDVVLSTGLFPHNLFSRKVLVEDEWYPTGYGIRPLTAAELADLWDVPLLFQELAAKVDGGCGKIKDLLQSPPAKILLLGGDFLLANYFCQSKEATPTLAGAFKRQRTESLDDTGTPSRKSGRDCDKETLGTEACSVEEATGLDPDNPGIGCWLTEEEDVREHTPYPNPVDVTFIIEQEDPLLIPPITLGSTAT